MIRDGHSKPPCNVKSNLPMWIRLHHTFFMSTLPQRIWREQNASYDTILSPAPRLDRVRRFRMCWEKVRAGGRHLSWTRRRATRGEPPNGRGSSLWASRPESLTRFFGSSPADKGELFAVVLWFQFPATVADVAWWNTGTHIDENCQG